MSPKIQNELIQILSFAVQNEIIEELKEAGFYSVITDTTQDLSKMDQMSQIFRYVVIHKDVYDHSDAGLTDKTFEIIEEKGLSVKMCRGQGYDGAAVMSGV